MKGGEGGVLFMIGYEMLVVLCGLTLKYCVVVLVVVSLVFVWCVLVLCVVCVVLCTRD